MDNTILQQGSFTSTGNNVTLAIRSDVDWIQVYNYTQFAAGTGSGQVVWSYWQRGMAAGTGLAYTKTATTLAAIPAALASGGFTLIDSSVTAPGPLNATITAISNASIPVATNSSTIASLGLVAGNVVRLINVVGGQQLGGYDFTIGYNTLGTYTFSLDYMAQIVTTTTGSWRLIPYNPLFYPSRRRITKITKASSAVITLSVTHGYTVGQAVRITVPAAFGMVEMNNLVGNITAINTNTSSGNTITVDIDSTSFTTFAFPLTAAGPFTPAEVVPVGEDTALANSLAVNVLGDSTINTGYIGIILGGGAASPAGASSDVIYWVAGKSFSNNGV